MSYELKKNRINNSLDAITLKGSFHTHNSSFITKSFASQVHHTIASF